VLTKAEKEIIGFLFPGECALFFHCKRNGFELAGKIL
jgi:hypothetical protein